MSESISAINVLLVCVGGITTNVLAKRLQQQLLLQGYKDHIEATGIFNLEDKAKQCDLILVAPQAQVFYPQIRAIADNLAIPIEHVDEEALTQENISGVIEKIMKYHRGSCKIRRSEATPKVKFTPVIFMDIGFSWNCLGTKNGYGLETDRMVKSGTDENDRVLSYFFDWLSLRLKIKSAANGLCCLMCRQLFYASTSK